MRQDGWEELLLAKVQEMDSQPFSWGHLDCILSVLECACEIRPDLSPFLEHARGSYGDAKEARRYLRDMGARELENALMMHLDPVPVSMAQRGDIGIVIDGGAQCAVICVGAVWIGKTETGAIRVPRHLVARAFKV
jgi:hypothetical protein